MLTRTPALGSRAEKCFLRCRDFPSSGGSTALPSTAADSCRAAARVRSLRFCFDWAPYGVHVLRSRCVLMAVRNRDQQPKRTYDSFPSPLRNLQFPSQFSSALVIHLTMRPSAPT